MKNDDLNIHEIAIELNRSTRTIRRYHAARLIPTFQIGNNTSPIMMKRADLKKLKNKVRK